MYSADDRPFFFSKIFKSQNFYCHNYIQHEKCIKTSTNKPIFLAVVLEIAS